MPTSLTLTTIRGPIETPLGEKPANGVLYLALRAADTEGATTIAPHVVSIPLDVEGDFSRAVWATEAGDHGQPYTAVVKWWSEEEGKLRQAALGYLAVPIMGPVNVADLWSTTAPVTLPADVLASALASSAAAAAALAEVSVQAAVVNAAAGISEQSRLALLRGTAWLKQDNGPFVMVVSGQSNPIGSNNDMTGTVETDPGVFILNTDTDDWQISQPGVPAGPYTYNTTGPGFPNPNNFAHQMALRVRRDTGRLVYIILDARGSTSITEWLPGWTVRDMFGALNAKVLQALATPELAGKTKADVVLWHQGEQDTLMSTATYRAAFYDVVDRFWGASWFDQDRPMIVGELAYDTVYDAQNALHSTHNLRGIRSIVTASAKGLAVDSSGVHFTGAALQELGYNRFANAYYEWLANQPTLDFGDIYKTYPAFFNPEDLGQEPVAARTLIDFLCSTPNGLRSGTGPFTELEGKTGYRTLIGSSLAADATVPTDMPGGLFRLLGNANLPAVVALGYTVTLLNISMGRVVVDAPGAGVIATEQGNISAISLGPLEAVTLVAFAADGSSWLIKSDARSSRGIEASVADDAVLTLTPPNNAGQIAITVNPNAASPNIEFFGTVAYDVGATPNCLKFSGGALLSAVTTDVTGTTGGAGTDGQITVGVVVGAVKIQNRSGNLATLRYQWVA